MADIVQGQCQKCGRPGPVMNVSFMRNIGLLVMRLYAKQAGFFCRRCADSTFWEMTLITFFFGWWGMISFFFTPVILINNFSQFVATRKLPFPDAAYDPLTQQYAPPPKSKWPLVAGIVAAVVILPCVGTIVYGAVAGAHERSSPERAKLTELESHVTEGQAWGNNDEAKTLSTILLKTMAPVQGDDTGAHGVATHIVTGTPQHIVTLVKFNNMASGEAEDHKLIAEMVSKFYQPLMRPGDKAYVAFGEFSYDDLILEGTDTGAWGMHTTDTYEVTKEMALALNEKPGVTPPLKDGAIPSTTDLDADADDASAKKPAAAPPAPTPKSQVVPASAKTPVKKKRGR